MDTLSHPTISTVLRIRLTFGSLNWLHTSFAILPISELLEPLADFRRFDLNAGDAFALRLEDSNPEAIAVVPVVVFVAFQLVVVVVVVVGGHINIIHGNDTITRARRQHFWRLFRCGRSFVRVDELEGFLLLEHSNVFKI